MSSSSSSQNTCQTDRGAAGSKWFIINNKVVDTVLYINTTDVRQPAALYFYHPSHTHTHTHTQLSLCTTYNALCRCNKRFLCFLSILIRCFTSDWVVGCWRRYLSRRGADLHMAQWCPCLLLQYNPAWFWYRLTRVIRDKVQRTVERMWLCVSRFNCFIFLTFFIIKTLV